MVWRMLYCTTGFQSEADPSRPAGSSAVVICPLLVCVELQSLCSLRASVGDGCVPLELSLSDSCPGPSVPYGPYLAIMPHPSVELILKPAPLPAPFPLSALATAPWLLPKLLGRVGVLFHCTKHGVSGTLPSTFLAKQINRLRRLGLLTLALCCAA